MFTVWTVLLAVLILFLAVGRGRVSLRVELSWGVECIDKILP